MNNIKSKNNEKQQIEDLVISKSIVVKWKIVNFFKNIVCAITLLLIIYSIFIEPDSTGIKYELIDKTTIENVKILDKIKTQNNEIKYRVQIGKRKEIVTESVYKKYIADINALEVPQTSLLIYNPEDDLDGFSNAKQFTLINYPWNKKRLFDEANTKECVKIIKKNNDLSVESIAKQLPVVIDSATNVFVQPGSELKEYKINNKFPKIPSGVIPIMIWVFWLLGIANINLKNKCDSEFISKVGDALLKDISNIDMPKENNDFNAKNIDSDTKPDNNENLSDKRDASGN